MRNLLVRLLVRNRNFLIATALLLGGFQFLLCAIVVSLNLESALEEILQFAPPMFSAMIEQTMLGGSTAGVLAFGWNHPITHALVTAVSITLGARTIAGEVEHGAIELILAQPLSRTTYLAAHLLFGALALAFVVSIGALGTMLGQTIFEIGAFGTGRLAQLLLTMLLLQLALYSITLLASAWGREAGRVALIGVLATLVSYFTNVIATLWPAASFLNAYSLHSYYDPRAILVTSGLSAAALFVLAGVTTVCVAAALRRFATRDLP